MTTAKARAGCKPAAAAAGFGFHEAGKVAAMDGPSDASQLRAHYGEVHPLARQKVLDRLDRHCRAFIALSPLAVLATADAEGRVDASPRGDAPGFAQVLDDTTLLLPDRPGNNRVDSYGNVLSHPGVGLLFLVPGLNETLRVNGTARIVTEPALLASAEAQGKPPRAGLLISVQEAFFHCGKALIRAKLWDAGRHVPRGDFPSLGRVVAEQTGACTVEEADQRVEEGYRTRLY
jgi:PPOX class probable FMN-dependent enzyme